MQELKSTKVKLYWKRKAKENGGAAGISFDGIPFVYVGEKNSVVPSRKGQEKEE